jgi:lipid II isoglutaminyl synthase (glutamine-hydrolysing)
MKLEDRDLLLQDAWQLDPLSDQVDVLSKIATSVGSGRSLSSPADLPPWLRTLAEATFSSSRERGWGGTTAPGVVLLRHSPGALRLLGRRLARGCILVGGTNGKTTTAGMIAAILRSSGHAVAHNQAGANVPAGIATALLTRDADIGVLEVDEAWLPLVAAELSPIAIVLGNLFRDRLDGYGEVEALARSWGEMILADPDPRLVLNVDDPVIGGLGSIRATHEGPQPSFFGVEDRTLALSEPEHALDSVSCRSCGGSLRFDARMLSHLGHYRCPGCGRARSRPDVAAEAVRIDGVSGSSFSVAVGAERLNVRLAVPGLYNVYNALAASAAALAVGVEPTAIPSALESYVPAFGRGERVGVGGTELLILLMKNPSGANELLRTLGRDRCPAFDLLIALNDHGADGRDVSWIWDVDFEMLRSRVGQVVCSGSRAAELALRLKYAEWDVAHLSVEPEIPEALDRGLAKGQGRLVVLPTYSALLELRIELARRGFAAPYWSENPVGPSGDPGPLALRERPGRRQAP